MKYIPNISNKTFKKFRKNKYKHLSQFLKKFSFNFGFFALQARNSGFLEGKEIESCRKTIVRHLSRKGTLWIHCKPYKPFTAKGSKTRMGTGRGNISCWKYPTQKGDFLFELSGVSFKLAKFALLKASFKLSLKTKFIYKI